MRTTAVNNVLVTSLQHPCKRPTTMAPGRSSMAPGPRVLPLIGNLHEVGIGKLAPAFPSQQPHRRFAALAKIHGDVMTIGMGSEPWLVLSSPEAVHEAFVSKGSDFAGRPMVTSMKISSGGKGASPVLRALPARCLRVACELPGPFHSTHGLPRAQSLCFSSLPTRLRTRSTNKGVVCPSPRCFRSALLRR